MARLFISYKRNVSPDEQLANDLYNQLSGEHKVFIDKTLLIGQDWVRRIQQELEKADFLLLLLSEQSVQSQMVVEEIRMAEGLRKQNGKPLLLPIRVSYKGGLPYDLGAILNRI